RRVAAGHLRPRRNRRVKVKNAVVAANRAPRAMVRNAPASMPAGLVVVVSSALTSLIGRMSAAGALPGRGGTSGRLGRSVSPPGSVASWPGICGTPPGTGTTLCALAFGSFGRPGLTGWLAFLAGASGAAESRPARYGFTGPWWWDEETTLALPRQPAAASPRIATALPQTFTGAVIGATIWLPPRIDPRPEVRLPPAPLPEP